MSNQNAKKGIFDGDLLRRDGTMRWSRDRLVNKIVFLGGLGDGVYMQVSMVADGAVYRCRCIRDAACNRSGGLLNHYARRLSETASVKFCISTYKKR
jgi:hypothetical protein